MSSQSFEDFSFSILKIGQNLKSLKTFNHVLTKFENVPASLPRLSIRLHSGWGWLRLEAKARGEVPRNCHASAAQVL